MFDPAFFSEDFELELEPEPSPEPEGPDTGPWISHGTVHLGRPPNH